MSSFNRVIIMGTLGQDPDFKTLNSGTKLCNLSIATNDGFGEKKKTNWHKITVWGKQAEACSTYLKKGATVIVEGRLEYESFTPKSGGSRQTVAKIQADRVQFMSKAPAAGGEASDTNESQEPNEDLPF